MRPETEAELSALIRDASAPLRITGGGTRGFATGAGEALTTAGLSGVTLYEPAALTLVAQAGTPLAEVETLLATERQRLSFEPPRMERLLGRTGVSTLGGVVAANASGPRRIQSGACRDALIGMRFVDGRGTVVKNGGRVMKNVTGYDLVKLIAGSRGALGVLTEVAFKLQPIPPASATLILPGLDPAQAVQALTAALGSPFDVTGAAVLAGIGALIRIEGLEASVAYRADRLRSDLSRFGEGEIERDPARIAVLWAAVRDVEPFHDRPGAVWRISTRPSLGAEVVRRVGGEVLLDWGGGLIWALTPEGEDLRPKLQGLPGHATLIRGTGAPVLPPEPDPVARLTRALKAQFDPRGLFAA